MIYFVNPSAQTSQKPFIYFYYFFQPIMTQMEETPTRVRETLKMILC